MSVGKEHVTRVVVAFCAPTPDQAHFVGEMVGLYDCPTAIVHDDYGNSKPWAAHLCRPATQEEAEVYWRNRALAAEVKLMQRGEDGR